MLEGPTHKHKKFVRLQNKILRLIEIPATPYALQRCVLGLISKRVASMVLLCTGHHIRGFIYHVDKYALKHIHRKHKFTMADFLTIPSILHQPDVVKHSVCTKQGLPAIIFEKTVGDDIFICIIEIRANTRVLAIKTCYKNRKTPC